MYPTQEDIMLPLLRSIARRGGSIIFSDAGDDIEEELADHFHLTDDQRYETREHLKIKDKRVWRLNIQWARKKCIKHGWLDGSVRNVWSLTHAGPRHVGL